MISSVCHLPFVPVAVEFVPSTGDLFVASSTQIATVSRTGRLAKIIGARQPGHQDGSKQQARFRAISAMCASNGSLFVTDAKVVREIKLSASLVDTNGVRTFDPAICGLSASADSVVASSASETFTSIAPMGEQQLLVCRPGCVLRLDPAATDAKAAFAPLVDGSLQAPVRAAAYNSADGFTLLSSADSLFTISSTGLSSTSVHALINNAGVFNPVTGTAIVERTAAWDRFVVSMPSKVYGVTSVCADRDGNFLVADPKNNDVCIVAMQGPRMVRALHEETALTCMPRVLVSLISSYLSPMTHVQGLFRESTPFSKFARLHNAPLSRVRLPLMSAVCSDGRGGVFIADSKLNALYHAHSSSERKEPLLDWRKVPLSSGDYVKPDPGRLRKQRARVLRVQYKA